VETLLVPEPGPEEVRVSVSACGICHSDAYVLENSFPGISYPRVPGHEIVGRVDAVGEAVEAWEPGDRIGAGWHGGHCFTCEPCRRGQFRQCETGEVTGVTTDGGYAEYVTVPTEALAAVPETLTAVEAAPLLCAGLTTYNALRHTDARSGDLVAVQGIGGLGHLGLQYAAEAGFETVAVSGSPEKESLARSLGADHFVDTTGTDPAEQLQDLGGASVILATAPDSDALSAAIGGLGVDGELVAVGVPGEPIEVDIAELVASRGSVSGWSSGHPREAEATLEFSAAREITPTVETYPLAEVEEAYERMADHEARFRVVLEP
jgi:NADPH2:quinone reductase